MNEEMLERQSSNYANLLRDKPVEYTLPSTNQKGGVRKLRDLVKVTEYQIQTWEPTLTWLPWWFFPQYSASARAREGSPARLGVGEQSQGGQAKFGY